MRELIHFNWRGFDLAAGIKVSTGLFVMLGLTWVTGETWIGTALVALFASRRWRSTQQPGCSSS